MADEDTGATPNGLLQCLGMLVDEAEAMRLARTSAALRTALNICRAEATLDLGHSVQRPAGSALH